jgi:hypothetical protein
VSKIINFEERSKKYKFDEQVVSVFLEKNKFYDFLEDINSGVAFLHHNQYIYVFFSYISRGEFTDMPTLSESFSGIQISPKISQGEWFVDKIVKLKKDTALKTLPLIYSSHKETGWLDDFKNQVIINSKEKEKDNEE